MENIHVSLKMPEFGTKIKVVTLPIGLKVLRNLTFSHKLGILERLYGKTLAQEGVCWVETSNSVIWKLDLRDATQRWIVFGDYEGPAQMQWLRNWLNLGGVVIDSGANIGQLLLYLASLPDVRIYAFEPLPDAADWLEECLVNYPNWKVTLTRQGLSCRKGDIPIQIDGSRSTTRMDWYVESEFPKSTITVISLDEFLAENRVEKIRLWKLDVEGHELHALRGAERYLKSQRIEALLVEDSGSGDVIDYLVDCGYSLHHIGGGGCLAPISKISRSYGNILALPKNK